MENRFDKVAIAIAEGMSSRRNALKWLSGILPATFFGGALGERQAFADDNKQGNNGNKDVKKRCHDFCKDVLPHQREQCEDACENCKGDLTGLCGSPGSFVCCSTGTVCCHSVNAYGATVAVCTDTNLDPNNCGTCGNVCVGGTCVNGQCVPNCAPFLTTCAGICTDTSKDALNCGACGKVCASGQLCTNGVCTCPAGMTLCTSSTGAPACVNTQTDPGNCGACAKICAAGQSCVSGSCTAVSVVPGCSSSTVGETFDAYMHGCVAPGGQIAYSARASLCGPGFHVCTAAEWVNHRGGQSPAHTYWTGDNPLYFGFLGTQTTGNCSVSPSPGTNPCSGGAMLVCPNTTDPEGHTCNITACGLDSTVSQFFGGCAQPSSFIASGTLCCG